MQQFGNLLALTVILLALWRGGASAREAAIATGAAWLVGLAVSFVPAHLTPLVLLASDGLLASALLLVAIRYSSPWQGGSMLIQSAAFFAHAWALAEEGRGRNYAYLSAINVLSLALLLSILIPTLIRWRRLARRGAHARGVVRA